MPSPDGGPRPPSRPLRVVVVIDDLRVAGAQRGVVEEIKALAPDRVDFRVIVLGDAPWRSLTPELEAHGTPVWRLPGRGLRDIRRVPRLSRVIRRIRPDLVHTHLEYANIIGPIAARLAGCPVLASLRSVTVRQSRWPTAKRLLVGIVLRSLATRVIVVAASAVDESRRNFHLPAGKLLALANAIDLSRLSLPPGFDRAEKRRELGVGNASQVICTVARLHPAKGHRLLFRAADTIVDRFPGVAFLIVGTGDDEPSLRAAAAGSSVAGSIHFLGERPDVAEILAASDLFVLPSFQEGLSRAMLEAMALGVPVVATHVGGAADVLASGCTGWLIPPGDVAALANAMQAALDGPRQAAELASRARELIEREFSIDAHADQLLTIYRTVLADTRH